jgi:arylsulfatase A-like enzyme
MKVALVVLDATRKDYLGPYGGQDGSTPMIDELAESGVVFTNCIAGAPWTPASHATMFTSQYPSGHGVRADSLTFPEKGYYLPESLSEAGIRTQCVGSEPWLSRRQNVDRGWDVFHDTGGHSLQHYLPFLPAGLSYLRDRTSNILGENTGTGRFSIHLFNQLAKHSNSFTFINISVAHSPYDPPEYFSYNKNCSGKEHPFLKNQNFYQYIGGEKDLKPEVWDALRKRYAAGISHADHLLKQALNGLDEDTWIILTADHGELLGESGLALHQFSLRDELINVPLIVSHPSLDHHIEDRMVSHVDIGPTISDIAAKYGFDVETPTNGPGRSLLDEGPSDRIVFSEYGPPVVATNALINNCSDLSREIIENYFKGLQAAVNRDYKLVRKSDGEENFYRRADEDTLISKEDICERLARAIDKNLGDLPEVDRSALDSYVDPAVETKLEDMGYL